MKNFVLFFIAAGWTVSSFAQVEVGGVILPGTLDIQGHTLKLNGAGVREKFWIDLYSAGLYLEEKSADAPGIITAERPMGIRLHIVSKLITSEKMSEAVMEGFEKSTNGNTQPVQDEINQILSFFEEDIHKNDIFDLIYLPSEGVIAFKNGKRRGVIKGKEFKEALFGIWLSERPADGDLKSALLGK